MRREWKPSKKLQAMLDEAAAEFAGPPPPPPTPHVCDIACGITYEPDCPLWWDQPPPRPAQPGPDPDPPAEPADPFGNVAALRAERERQLAAGPERRSEKDSDRANAPGYSFHGMTVGEQNAELAAYLESEMRHRQLAANEVRVLVRLLLRSRNEKQAGR